MCRFKPDGCNQRVDYACDVTLESHSRYGMVTTVSSRVWVVTLLVCLSAGWRMAAGDDFQSWNTVQVSFAPAERFEWTTMAEGRLYEDASQWRHKRVGQLIRYTLSETVSVGLNFRYTDKESGSGVRSSERRWELALYQTFAAMGRWRWDLRHRLEQVRPSNTGDAVERTRHRIRVRRAVEGPVALSALFATAEAFYEFSRSRIVETRIIPLGMSFALAEQHSLSAAYMVRSVRRSQEWEHAHVLELSWATRL